MSLLQNRTRIPLGTTHCRPLSVDSGARKGKS
jgi:hypothetical protein